jgi:hypothetical protein
MAASRSSPPATSTSTLSQQHPRLPALHPDERELVNGGLDRITVIPAEATSPQRVSTRAVGTHRVDLDIDGHNAHAVDLRLTAAVD